MTGIIGAMEKEVDGIRGMLRDSRTETAGGLTFTVGFLGNEEIVAAVCGIGKVFAAVCAQTMILTYSPDRILNVGVGGALDPELRIGDIVVADAVVQHDMDTTALGDPKGLISGIGLVRLPCDPSFGGELREAAEAAGLRVSRGVIASGDKFLSSASEKREVREEFGASVCEMEGAAVGQVCFSAGIPFCVMRAVSDGAGDDGELDYFAFCSLAAKNTERVLRRLFPSP